MNMEEHVLSSLGSIGKLHQLPAREVAEELARMDAEQLRKIAPQELEDGAWMKKDKKYDLAPNVMLMVQSFNRLALLVTTEILAEKTPQARSKVITNFIKIARKCHRMHNYNSLKAVLAGLQCTPIYRLTKTWKVVPSKRKKMFKQLSAVMSEEENWCLYREEIQRMLNTNTALIPFLGVFLTTIALQQQAQGMISAKLKETLRRNSTLCDDYVHLEAITVRNRLERLRSKDSSFEVEVEVGGESDGGGGCESPGQSENSESSGSDCAMEQTIDSNETSLQDSSLFDAYKPSPTTSLPASLTAFSGAKTHDCTESSLTRSSAEKVKTANSNNRATVDEQLSPEPRPHLEPDVTIQQSSLRSQASRDRLDNILEPPTLESSHKSHETNNAAAQVNSLRANDTATLDTPRKVSPSSGCEEDTFASSGLHDGATDHEEGTESLTAMSRRKVFKQSKELQLSGSLECLLDISCNHTTLFQSQSSVSLEDLPTCDATVKSHCSSIIPPASFHENRSPTTYHSPTALLKQSRLSTPKKLIQQVKRPSKFQYPFINLSASGYQIRYASLQYRRGCTHVPKTTAAQNERSDTPIDILQRYQILSIGCPQPRSGGNSSKVELRARTLISVCPHNTEAQNYKLSYEREPL